jgi:hypothetical protein
MKHLKTFESYNQLNEEEEILDYLLINKKRYLNIHKIFYLVNLKKLKRLKNILKIMLTLSQIQVWDLRQYYGLVM